MEIVVWVSLNKINRVNEKYKERINIRRDYNISMKVCRRIYIYGCVFLNVYVCVYASCVAKQGGVYFAYREAQAGFAHCDAVQ